MQERRKPTGDDHAFNEQLEKATDQLVNVVFSSTLSAATKALDTVNIRLRAELRKKHKEHNDAVRFMLGLQERRRG